jgi:hypothetical protein
MEVIMIGVEAGVAMDATPHQQGKQTDYLIDCYIQEFPELAGLKSLVLENTYYIGFTYHNDISSPVDLIMWLSYKSHIMGKITDKNRLVVAVITHNE